MLRSIFPIGLAVFLSLCCGQRASIADGPLLKKKSLPPGKMEVLLIEQHGSVVGAQLVFIAPNAVRLDCLKRGTIVISKGPEWKVLSYSLVTKKWFETPFSQYSTLFKPTLIIYGLDLSGYKMKKTGVERLYGRDCSIYKPMPKSGVAENDQPGQRIQGVWVADDVSAASEVGDLMERELGLPAMHKPLIKFDYLQDKFNTHALSTTFCHPRIVSSNWFDLPPGLQKAKNNLDVYPGDSFKQFLP
jgi:hypothetical protein